MGDLARPYVAASVLAADFGRMADEVRRAEAAGADRIHWDVMDGHFVPNLTFGPQLVADCRAASDLPYDCHLMVKNPHDHIELFVAAGADSITIHVEADCPVGPTLSRIRAAGREAGLSLRPGTPLSALDRYLPVLDIVLVMSVEPGRGGQAFLPEALDRIRALAARRAEKGYGFRIEVDGGVDAGTGRAAVAAGADGLVAGTFFFGHAEGPAAAVRALRGE